MLTSDLRVTRIEAVLGRFGSLPKILSVGYFSSASLPSTHQRATQGDLSVVFKNTNKSQKIRVLEYVKAIQNNVQPFLIPGSARQEVIIDTPPPPTKPHVLPVPFVNADCMCPISEDHMNDSCAGSFFCWQLLAGGEWNECKCLSLLIHTEGAFLVCLCHHLIYLFIFLLFFLLLFNFLIMYLFLLIFVSFYLNFFSLLCHHFKHWSDIASPHTLTDSSADLIRTQTVPFYASSCIEQPFLSIGVGEVKLIWRFLFLSKIQFCGTQTSRYDLISRAFIPLCSG